MSSEMRAMRMSSVFCAGLILALQGCVDDEDAELNRLQAELDALKVENAQTQAELAAYEQEANAPLTGGLASDDPAIAREAARTWAMRGKSALPDLRHLIATSPSPVVRKRAKDAIGRITGNWGSQVDLVWERSLEGAVNRGKPILLLQLFGKLDEEFC